MSRTRAPASRRTSVAGKVGDRDHGDLVPGSPGCPAGRGDPRLQPARLAASSAVRPFGGRMRRLARRAPPPAGLAGGRSAESAGRSVTAPARSSPGPAGGNLAGVGKDRATPSYKPGTWSRSAPHRRAVGPPRRPRCPAPGCRSVSDLAAGATAATSAWDRCRHLVATAADRRTDRGGRMFERRTELPEPASSDGTIPGGEPDPAGMSRADQLACGSAIRTGVQSTSARPAPSPAAG